MNDDDEILKTLARMRDVMLKVKPELLATTVSCALECALELEIYQTAILKENAELKDYVSETNKLISDRAHPYAAPTSVTVKAENYDKLVRLHTNLVQKYFSLRGALKEALKKYD